MGEKREHKQINCKVKKISDRGKRSTLNPGLNRCVCVWHCWLEVSRVRERVLKVRFEEEPDMKVGRCLC